MLSECNVNVCCWHNLAGKSFPRDETRAVSAYLRIAPHRGDSGQVNKPLQGGSGLFLNSFNHSGLSSQGGFSNPSQILCRPGRQTATGAQSTARCAHHTPRCATRSHATTPPPTLRTASSVHCLSSLVDPLRTGNNITQRDQRAVLIHGVRNITSSHCRVLIIRDNHYIRSSDNRVVIISVSITILDRAITNCDYPQRSQHQIK